MTCFRHGRRLSTAVMTTLLMATLAGCGSDDNNNNTSTPPPSGNDPNPPTTPQPTLSRLTLTGKVTDAPIANAVVSATVGDETFTVNADADGNYSLEIEIEEDATDGFVTLSARGVDSQSYVEFTSLAGTFSALQAQAGSDETLSNTENFATQITNVSTAQAVLLREANGGQPVTSPELLRTLSATLNSQEVLDLATAIKLLVDDSANYPLPDGETSLLNLIADSAAREQFVDTTYNQNPTTFASTQSSIVNDSTLTRPVTNDTLPTSLTVAMLSDATDFTFNYFNRVNSYTFNADGTGTVAAGSWNVETTWQIQGTSVEIMYGDTVMVTSWDVVDCDGAPAQVRAEYRSDGARLNLLSDRVLAITETTAISYPSPGSCSNLETHEVTNTVARTILADDDFELIDVQELQGATQSIYVYNPDTGVTADIADLNADGSGSTWAFGKQFNWEIDATGRVITATFDDGTVGTFRTLAEVDDITSDLLFEFQTPEGRFVDAGATVYADPELPLVFTAEAMPGRFYQFGMGLEGSADPRLKSFRLRFDNDLTGSLEDDFIDEDDQLVTQSESTDPWMAFRWSIDGEDVVVRHTFDVGAFEYNCVFGEVDCVLFDERRLVPLALNGARAYWMEYRRQDDLEVTADTIPTTLIRFYDYEPLGAGAIMSSKSAEGSARKLRFNGASKR